MGRRIEAGEQAAKKTISFYPGPSKVEPQVPRYVMEGYQQGVLSANHRSPTFTDLYEQTVNLIYKRLRVPTDYGVVFTSSATECWEIIAQSLIRQGSFHLYNGAFGAKWFDYTHKLQAAASSLQFGLHDAPPVEEVRLPKDTDLIAITHNETSNGTQWSTKSIIHLRERFPEQLLAVDATSSMAGVSLPYEAADVWYASVQKCFGLPAGLGVLLLSPRAMQAAREAGEHQHYNSLNYLLDHMANWQTGHTPNVLGIWLLYRVLQKRKGMKATDRQVRRHRQEWQDYIMTLPHVSELVTNPHIASKTVITLQMNAEWVPTLLQDAQRAGFVLGKGYGPWQDSTVRIANFPQHTRSDMLRLQEFLKRWFLQR